MALIKREILTSHEVLYMTWIVIYLVDSAIHLLNNWGQK